MRSTVTPIITVVAALAVTGVVWGATPAAQQARQESVQQPEQEIEKLDVPDDIDLDWKNETDPFQRCAKKALSGEYGELTFWQQAAYIWGLQKDLTCTGVAKVTSYGYRWEPRWLAGGKWTASGSHVHLAGCAANPEIEFGVLIWTPYGLRYVTDRGGWVKLNRTNARESANFDYYTWEGWSTLRNAPYAVVKRSGDRTVWKTKDTDEVRP